VKDYEQGQVDLINYIKSQMILISKTSKGQDQILDVINLLKNLKPLKESDYRKSAGDSD
jgi:hypothetical protein